MPRLCPPLIALLALAGLAPLAAQTAVPGSVAESAATVPEAAGAVLWQFDTGG